MQLVLASASPRRKELLEKLGVSFSTLVGDVDEAVHAGESAAAYVQRLAREKAAAVMPLLEQERKSVVIIGSDTAVEMNRRIFGKPDSSADAQQILAEFSGAWHTVHTGVCAIRLDGGTEVDSRTIVESTAVKFRSLGEEEIASYVQSGEPLDKAGAYGIQGGAAAFVERIEGSYTSVVGLPLSQTAELIRLVSGGMSYVQ